LRTPGGLTPVNSNKQSTNSNSYYQDYTTMRVSKTYLNDIPENKRHYLQFEG